jgi:hypothetical protein
VKKRGIRLSKTLVKAQLLSLLTVMLAGLAIYLALVNIPGTAWAKEWHFIRDNNNNPEIFFSDYYQKLSAYTNQDDWIICTPISFLFGGVVFGSILISRQSAVYVARAATIVSVFWCAVVLTLCTIGPAVEAHIAEQYGYRLPMPELTWRVGGMVILQSVYWTIFFVIGSQAAPFLNRSSSTRQAGKLRQGALPAGSNK